MVLKFNATIMKVGNSLVITIPKAICDGFELKKGQKLELTVTDDGIYIPLKIEQKPE